MYLYDADNVESVNMAGQFFTVNDVNQAKVSAISNALMIYSNYYSANTFSSFFTEVSPATNIMICGFDSMNSRKMYYNSWKNLVALTSEENKKYTLFIDGRMSAETIQVFAFTGDDSEAMIKYEQEWLFDDREAEAVTCSYKQTSFCAAMIGSIITNLFVNFCANLADDFRPLPFYTEYDATLMNFKTV